MAYRKKAAVRRKPVSRSSAGRRGAVKRRPVSYSGKRRAAPRRAVSRAPQTIRIVMETMPQAYMARPEGMLVPQTEAVKPRKAKF